MTASIREINFTKVPLARQLPSGVLRHSGSPREEDSRPTTPDGTLLTPKQIRARARRRAKRMELERKMSPRKRKTQNAITAQEFEALYKPIEEWDIDELARGCPRTSNGAWPARTPGWITREVTEQALERFGEVVKSRMGEQTINALDTVQWVMTNKDVDHRGKPIVPPSTQLQAAQFLLEHVVGKPKQHVTQDISVKLQGILGSVMVNPNEALAPPSQGGAYGDEEANFPGYSLAHLPGHTIPIGVEQEEEEVIEGEVL